VVRVLWIAIPALILALLAFRHPFIGRRLAIMVPTLLVISVIVFAMVQLPPGDYLSSKIIQLQETGDSTAESQIKDLHELFHYDDPQWKLYARWMGFMWFTSFTPSDQGLLQGNLGRSMETQQPINSMIGDRITLTVIVSLATILFTWAIALPIGIYSAVRQYSTGDYILTLVGFVGMCVPAFLLALVLIAVSGMSGLFSPEFAAQPEWTWAKAMDLVKHIWIPIVVLGIGGTAGMIRIMRANLLDELKKPYVTTALAKGVRPMKLLVKYPVRLALNPFVSGIGHLFPQLISGGAIVATVLALPMVGPLQLQAVMTQDVYLAGSMLMVLSLLGVVGTLVSDLLLLWLDPRIRFEGGGR
jgi:ABC-type dipeptide/oligopeptide/nickel transport system permease component